MVKKYKKSKRRKVYRGGSAEGHVDHEPGPPFYVDEAGSAEEYLAKSIVEKIINDEKLRRAREGLPRSEYFDPRQREGAVVAGQTLLYSGPNPEMMMPMHVDRAKKEAKKEALLKSLYLLNNLIRMYPTYQIREGDLSEIAGHFGADPLLLEKILSIKPLLGRQPTAREVNEYFPDGL